MASLILLKQFIYSIHHLQADTVGRILAHFNGGKFSDIFLEYIQTQLTNEPPIPKKGETHRYASILILIKGRAGLTMSNDSLQQIYNGKKFWDTWKDTKAVVTTYYVRWSRLFPKGIPSGKVLGDCLSVLRGELYPIYCHERCKTTIRDRTKIKR